MSLRHQNDINNAIKEYIDALYFNKDEVAAINAMKDEFIAYSLFEFVVFCLVTFWKTLCYELKTL